MKKNGFTLLELLIGVSLISIIMVFLFRLLFDIQHEGLSNTYIVSNQTNRNEMISILDTAMYENGDVCDLYIGASNTNKLYKIGFCNHNEIDVTISKNSVLIEYEGSKYNFPMKDSSAYYEIALPYSIVSFHGKKLIRFTIKTHKKGLRATVIDDIEIMGTVDDLKIKKENIDEFEYTGAQETFTATKTGNYQLEVWGAQGGNTSTYYFNGGYGGYSVGTVHLNQGDILRVVVGGQGESECNAKSCTGGFNGGGSSGWFTGGTVYTSGGGGATHIATNTNATYTTLESYGDDLTAANYVLIAAGGGGGATYHNNNSGTFGFSHNGGAGGGVIGYGLCGENDKADNGSSSGCGGSQTATGEINSETYGTYGAFGVGASNTCSNNGSGAGRKCYASGAGGGWYGGSTGNHGVAGGGSGYIANENLTNKSMYCYNCENSNVASTKTVSIFCAYEEATARCAKIGNGYARITYLGN